MKSPVQSDLRQIQAQFESWRRTRPSSRQPIPDHLRQAAIALLDRYPASTISRHCRIHYRILKPFAASRSQTRATRIKAGSRAVKQSVIASESARPLFFHLPAAPSPEAAAMACRLIVDRPDGARLTLTLPSLDQAALTALCDRFLRDTSQ